MRIVEFISATNCRSRVLIRPERVDAIADEGADNGCVLFVGGKTLVVSESIEEACHKLGFRIEALLK